MPINAEMPPWMARAYRDIGTIEVPGPGDNPIVMAYAKDAHVENIVTHDSVPWCAAHVGAQLEREGIKGSRQATAISYRDWGERLASPVLGCVIWLKPVPRVPGTGHVGFYVGTPGAGWVRLLGGNQKDAVNEADFNAARIGAMRWAPVALIRPEWVGPIMVSGPALKQPSDR